MGNAARYTVARRATSTEVSRAVSAYSITNAARNAAFDTSRAAASGWPPSTQETHRVTIG